MRAIAFVAILALFAAVTVAAESATIISEEVSEAEENDFAIQDQEQEQDEEAGEFAATVIDDSEEDSEDASFMAVDEEVEDQAESEDEELMAESDEAENEAEDESESEDEMEVDAIDEEVVEEENADVFAETDAEAKTAQEVLQWLNLARAGDSKVIAELTRMSKLFTDPTNKKIMVDGSLRLLTNEGVSAINGAISAMKKHKKVGALTMSNGLISSAAAHVRDQGSKGLFSHTGTDGSDPFTRMNRYGKWGGTAGENMGSGSNVGKSIVMQYLIDDGVPSRGHRTNVLNGAYHKVGVAIGSHTKYKYMNVCDFAGSYTEKKKF